MTKRLLDFLVWYFAKRQINEIDITHKGLRITIKKDETKKEIQ